jgi:hypothetical protein
MTNKNTFYSIIAITSPKLIDNIYNSIASSYYLSVPPEFPINSQIMREKLEVVYTNKLKVIIIDNMTK